MRNGRNYLNLVGCGQRQILDKWNGKVLRLLIMNNEVWQTVSKRDNLGIVATAYSFCESVKATCTL